MSVCSGTEKKDLQTEGTSSFLHSRRRLLTGNQLFQSLILRLASSGEYISIEPHPLECSVSEPRRLRQGRFTSSQCVLPNQSQHTVAGGLRLWIPHCKKCV